MFLTGLLTSRSLFFSSFDHKGDCLNYACTYHFSLCRCVVWLSAGTILWAEEGKGIQQNQDYNMQNKWDWGYVYMGECQYVCIFHAGQCTFCKIFVDGHATRRRLLPWSYHDSDARMPSSNWRWCRHLLCAHVNRLKLILIWYTYNTINIKFLILWICCICHLCKISVILVTLASLTMKRV